MSTMTTMSKKAGRPGRWRALGVWLALAFALAAVAGTGWAGPAAADVGSDRIHRYSVEYTLRADGMLEASETIDYEFASGASRHGIDVYYVVRADYPDQPDQYRLYPLRVLAVSSPTGAPAEHHESDSGPLVRVRVGDPDRTIEGRQTYVIRYEVAAVANGFADHQELYLNPIGTQWRIPIDAVDVRITAPKPATRVACYQGVRGSTQTCPAGAGATSTFSAAGLLPGQGLTAVAAYPLGTVSNTDPVLRYGNARDGGGVGESLSEGVARGLSLTAYSVGAALPVALGAAMGVLVWRRGRDERYVGLTPGLSPGVGEQAGVTRGGGGPIAVQFQPPPARPGMVGTLIDETANTVDISATVVDLAVRGFLTITEAEPGSGKRADWTLTQVLPKPDEPLMAYEQLLYDRFFDSGPQVALSSLRQTFATTLRRAQTALYREVVDQGWFRSSPSRTRSRWTAVGVVVAALGAAAAIGLGPVSLSVDRAGRSGWALPSGVALGAGLLVGGLLIVLLGRRLPAKTAPGSAVMAQSLGFRQYLLTAEANQITFEEAASIFSRYLPYAIVFGVADRWAQVFAEVASAAQAAGQPLAMPTWYLFHGSMATSFGSLAEGADSFTTMAAGTFTATPGASGASGFGGGSSGGGFSGGGGFGGGGGGSW